MRQGMAGKAEALMRFWGGQFLAIGAQMHGAIPIRGTDHRRHPRICHMGKAKRRREELKWTEVWLAFNEVSLLQRVIGALISPDIRRPDDAGP